MQKTWVWSLDQEDPLEKEMAAHSSILAWRIPWTEEPGRLRSMGSQRVEHDWVAKHSRTHTRAHTHTHTHTHTHHIPWLDAPVLCLLSWQRHVESFSHWVIHLVFSHNPSSFLLAHLPQSLKHICVGLGNNFKAALSWVTCHYTLLMG